MHAHSGWRIVPGIVLLALVSACAGSGPAPERRELTLDGPEVKAALEAITGDRIRQHMSALADDALADALQSLLIPQATLITPNTLELMELAPDADNIDSAAQALLATGCTFVLVTGTHEKTPEVVNRLYGNRRLLETFHWERLPHSYHGSGCTLAAACAATFAHGFDPIEAVAEAQDFTWHSLLHANRLGMGQHLPDRLYWARDEDEDDDSPADEPLH